MIIILWIIRIIDNILYVQEFKQNFKYSWTIKIFKKYTKYKISYNHLPIKVVWRDIIFRSKTCVTHTFFQVVPIPGTILMILFPQCTHTGGLSGLSISKQLNTTPFGMKGTRLMHCTLACCWRRGRAANAAVHLANKKNCINFIKLEMSSNCRAANTSPLTPSRQRGCVGGPISTMWLSGPRPGNIKNCAPKSPK